MEKRKGQGEIPPEEMTEVVKDGEKSVLGMKQ